MHRAAHRGKTGAILSKQSNGGDQTQAGPHRHADIKPPCRPDGRVAMLGQHQNEGSHRHRLEACDQRVGVSGQQAEHHAADEHRHCRCGRDGMAVIVEQGEGSSGAGQHDQQQEQTGQTVNRQQRALAGKSKRNGLHRRHGAGGKVDQHENRAQRATQKAGNKAEAGRADSHRRRHDQQQRHHHCQALE